MNLQTGLSLAVNIATFLTAIATFFTIIEMRKQRKESYKAIVIPIKKYFSLKSYEDGRYQAYTLRDGKYDTDLYIDLVNAGLGPACNIKGKWEFQFDDFIQKNDWSDYKVEYKESIFSIFASKWECKNYIDNQNTINVDYLLNNELNSIRVLFPSFITPIIKLSADQWKQGIETYIPPLLLKYEYQDVGMSIVRKTFYLRFKPIVLITIQTEPLLEYDAHEEIVISSK